MDKNWKNPEITDAPTQEDKKINDFRKYLERATLIIAALIILSIILSYTDLIDFIIIFFKYFDKSEQIIQFVIILVDSLELKGLVTLIIGLFSYFYLFEYIKTKGMYIYIDNEKEGKYFVFLLSFYAIFNFILIIPLIFYLFIVKGAIFEFGVILFFYSI